MKVNLFLDLNSDENNNCSYIGIYLTGKCFKGNSVGTGNESIMRLC